MKYVHFNEVLLFFFSLVKTIKKVCEQFSHKQSKEKIFTPLILVACVTGSGRNSFVHD